MGVETFNRQMHQRGWFLFPEFVPHDLIERLKYDLEIAYTRCREIQVESGIEGSEGSGHHICMFGASFLEYLSLFEKLNPHAEAFFGGKYILNTMGGNILKSGMSYASHIHRDMRSHSGSLPLMMNTLVMLDQFTVENGATWLMHRGHEWPNKPTEEEFAEESFQITGNAGSIVFFNSNLWHRAGENVTEKPRMALTPVFSKPFYKQQFEYSQLCDDNTSPWLKQIFGWYSRVPKTMDQWYNKDRFYRSDQE